MTEQDGIPELRLHLDGLGRPEEFLFYHPCHPSGDPVKAGDLVTVETEKGKWALSLLMVYTVKERISRAVRKSKIKLPKYAEEFTNTLAEAISNPKENKHEPHWLVKIFGENPQHKYLDAVRATTNSAYFCGPDVINLKVCDYRDVEIESGKLAQIFDDLLADDTHRAKKIDIRVRVRSASTGREYELDRLTCDGSLTKGDEVQIEVSPNYATYFAVFWVTSESAIHRLFPIPDADLEIQESTLVKGRLGSGVTIPEQSFFGVESGKGTESCVVVGCKEELEIEDLMDIQVAIEASKTKWSPRDIVKHPMGNILSRRRSEKQSCDESKGEDGGGFRLKAPREPSAWQELLFQNMPSSIASVHLLHLPNH